MVTGRTPTASGVVDRREVVAELIRARGEALIITGLGTPTYDVHEAGDDDRNYYLWGAMGGAALVGLGLALAQPGRRVMVVTGDGEQLMAYGALATISVSKPTNLDIFVLDNERYGETGMQTSHTGQGIDLASVAHASGFADTAVLRHMSEITALTGRADWDAASGPRLYVLKINAETQQRSLPSRDAVFIKNRFRSQLGLAPN